MPLWNIYHPEHTYTDADKLEIAERIVGFYDGFLPRFYVNVLFQPLPPASFLIGGKPTDDFVRIRVDHIARQIDDPGEQARFMHHVGQRLAPFIGERGLRWEIHIGETPFGLWTIEGLRPPRPGTPADLKWRTENRPSPY
ncbi:tautomerase family protein [Burkholderia contaminans]|uniref:tautomerase family protein n=1 Tax=Burkholderia sp. D-99 TaxID=2717316 RepID=UPI00141DA050|nr:tautomerase family protein [Burkholderia sp. D-99]MBZ5795252.1 tautomerase family protein [Burkholderia contaminans]NHV24671.1 4-oxalocrotonate tautomerase [Burkholderia sp. D-99]